MATPQPVGNDIVLPDGSRAPLSAAYRSAGLLFTSGQLAFDPDGALCTGSIAEQTRLCLENIQRLLALENLQTTSIVKITVWLTDTADFQGFNAAYREFFGEHRPARSTVQADLMLPGAKVEIEAVAAY
ncbi:RidA family protein [Parahaliea mediterranea]|uniref:RidA family protein n=1 Tax=Parahaliea mediterranea TaxID=651086 RepID=UPI0014739388|nr:RidA family protein [Parahaliea mediterranea]